MQRFRSRFRLWVLAVVAIAACSRNDGTAATVTAGAPTEATVTPVRPMACPGQDFRVFLDAFANDIEVQRSFTADPYTAVIDDSLHAETGPESIETPRAEVEFPVMLDETGLLRHGARMESRRKEQDWYEVLTYSEGSGAYSMTFNFRFRNGCWYLTDSVDTSS